MEGHFLVLHKETLKFTIVNDSQALTRVSAAVNSIHYDDNDPEFITIIVWVRSQMITHVPDLCLSIAEQLNYELWR